MNIQANDLLIEKSGGSEDQPVGRVSILTDNILKDNTIAYSNFIHKITVEGINPMYLYFYLKTMHNIKITDSMQSQTNGIRNLIMQEYLNQTIVVPPLQKQQEIVDHITATRKQAKALQEEGKEIIEQAKKEVEQMIIGDQ
jgi:type I restriction enzyme S subunit